MPSRPRRRHALFLVPAFGLVALLGGCKNWETVLIPRFDSGAASKADPFNGNVYRYDHPAEDQNYSILAVCIADTLILGTQVDAAFEGKATWTVGDCQIAFPIDPEASEVKPVLIQGDLGTSQPLVAIRTATEEAVTVRLELPRGTLTRADGTIILTLQPAGERDPIVLPVSGRLRGVFLAQ